MLGVQTPRLLHLPAYASTSGDEAIELAELAGLDLDPWQQLVLRHSLGERPNGSWAAFEVGLVVPRQSGKGGILEARELAGLFLLGEQLIVHSAHEFPTSLEAFRRLLELIEDTPDLDQLVKRVSRSHGEEGIELKGRQRIRFRTRTRSGGRGLTGDCLILDEAMILPESALSSLFFTLSARPNPQVWYVGSSVDQTEHEHGIVLSRIRQRGIEGTDPRLAYFEWSHEAEKPDDVDPDTAKDPEVWAQANPALGIRISAEHVEAEQRSISARSFAVERLGVGDWPDPAGGDYIIDPETWQALIEMHSAMTGRPCFAFDVNPDRSRAAIAGAGNRRDGLRHPEIIEHKRGTGWVAARLAQLQAAHNPVAIVCDERGPAGSLLPEIKELGLEVQTVNSTEHAQACGAFYDLVQQAGLRHLGTPELEAALKGAVKRPLGDAWAWSRKSSGVDISPLVAVTLALWGLQSAEPEDPPFNAADYRIRQL